MDDKLKSILSRIRKLAIEKGIENISVNSICSKLDISNEELFRYITDELDLVEKVLEFERESFKIIFDKYNFEGMNAIDILMIVSKEMAARYYDLTPTISRSLKQRYPAIYQDHFQKRSDFIFNKIQINLQKGISQGMYRNDLSIQLIARLYMSRLIDIHNEEIFPSDKFSFATLFEVMFENFVRSIATFEGLQYFESKKNTMDFNK